MIQKVFSSIPSDENIRKCSDTTSCSDIFMNPATGMFIMLICFIISASTNNGMAVCFRTVLWAGLFSNM